MALAKRAESGQSVRGAMVGAGYMARCIALQIVAATRGKRLVAISNRTPAKAERCYNYAGVTSITRVSGVSELEQTIASDRNAVTDDPPLPS